MTFCSWRCFDVFAMLSKTITDTARFPPAAVFGVLMPGTMAGCLDLPSMCHSVTHPLEEDL